MYEIDIKSQLDQLNVCLDNWMDSLIFDYFTIKSYVVVGREKPVTDVAASSSMSHATPYDCGDPPLINCNALPLNSSSSLNSEELQYTDGVSEYTDGLSEYTDGVSEYTDVACEYADAAYEYADAAYEYADAAYEYTDGVSEYTDGVSEYTDGVGTQLYASGVTPSDSTEYIGTGAGFQYTTGGLTEYTGTGAGSWYTTTGGLTVYNWCTSLPRVITKKKSRAIDIIDPSTGEKVLV